MSRDRFDDHWRRRADVPIAPSKLDEARAFLAPLAARAREPFRVLDVGCGDGAHATVIAGAHPAWAYAGVDLSLAAAAGTRARLHQRAPLMAVADGAGLPFASETFDAVFAYGVLAYTSDPARVLDEMVRVARPGALIGLWLYPRRRGLAGVAFTGVRRVCRALGPAASRPIVWSIVLALPWLPVQSGVSLRNATWTQCVEIVDVNLLPPVLGFYEAAQVEQWCRDRGLEIVANDAARPVTIWARRSA